MGCCLKKPHNDDFEQSKFHRDGKEHPVVWLEPTRDDMCTPSDVFRNFYEEIQNVYQLIKALADK